MTEPGDNLNLVISGVTAIQPTGSLGALGPILDENVFWQGSQPDPFLQWP